MFESDQHEPHDEVEESGGSGSSSSPSKLHDPSFYETDDDQPGADGVIEVKKKPFPLVIVGLLLLAVAVAAVLVLNRPKPADTPAPGDMGPGVSAASGLRGHLVTQWTGDARSGKLQYQLRVEPLQFSQAQGFSLVNAKPPGPYSMNIRLLDATGFALCGKEILFHYDPTKSMPPSPSVPASKGKKSDVAARIAAEHAAREADIQHAQTAEADRERGKDIFENQAGADGLISAVNAQGDLPCSADLYKRANYWDFTTTFPSVAEQDALRDPRAAAQAKRDTMAEEGQSGAARRKPAPKKPLSAFYIQGDDRASSFDHRRGVLEAEGGKSFLILAAAERSTASHWANNYSLIHYKCDQQAVCALTVAGGLSAVHARLN
jgi:hypothetical protein